MANTLVVAEKPSMADLAARHLPRLLDIPTGSAIHTVCASSMWAVVSRFRWPRDVRWRDIPRIVDPVYASDVDPLLMPAIRRAGTGKILPGDFDPNSLTVDRIVLAGTIFRSQVHAFEIALRSFPARDGVAVPVVAIVPGDVPALGDWNEIREHHLKPSILVRRFQYNHALNAFFLFGRAYEEATGRPSADVDARMSISSRSAIQILYALRGLEPMEIWEATDIFLGWKGTGRYHPAKGGFSSSRSMLNLLTMLGRCGLATSDPKALSISNEGLRFLDRLHPACEDADQQFRLEEWTMLPSEEGTAKVDRYLSTYFARQKRFLAKAATHPPSTGSRT